MFQWVQKIKAALTIRREALRLARYTEGYGWAYSELMKGKPVDSVEDDVLSGEAFDLKRDPFDVGATDAIRDWRFIAAAPTLPHTVSGFVT
jgi:hypothetical protein